MIASVPGLGSPAPAGITRGRSGAHRLPPPRVRRPPDGDPAPRKKRRVRFRPVSATGRPRPVATRRTAAHVRATGRPSACAGRRFEKCPPWHVSDSGRRLAGCPFHALLPVRAARRPWGDRAEMIHRRRAAGSSFSIDKVSGCDRVFLFKRRHRWCAFPARRGVRDRRNGMRGRVGCKKSYDDRQLPPSRRSRVVTPIGAGERILG